MAVRVEHGKPSTLLTAAQMKGEERAAQQQLERTERLQAQQREFEYRTSIRQQDMSIDLQMQERAKLWEIDKMQLRSQMDFQREEQARQRKLDSADSALQQIDKEVLAGRMTEQEAYPLKLKYEMNKLGVDVPTSLLPTGDEEDDRYGVRPYYLEPEFERDYPELAEAKKKEVISGQRRGTIPYYLDPTFISSYPEAARQAQEARGIFLSDEEFSSLTEGVTPELPLGDKQLDVGVRAEGAVEGGRVRVISPNGKTGSILRGEITEYRAAGFEILEDTPESPTETVLPQTTEDVVKQLEAGKERFRKPSLANFFTMSPLRALMERRKAKKLVR